MEGMIENGVERSRGKSKGQSNGTFPWGSPAGQPVWRVQGSAQLGWQPACTSQSAFCRLQSVTLHSFCYPSALIASGAELTWQRKMALLSARLAVLLRNYISCALGFPEFITTAFILSPETYSALSWLMQKGVSMCLT